MKNADKIRMSLEQLGDHQASNREIALYCENEYGFLPSPQAIYACVGSEKSRRAENFNGRELMDIKSFAKRKFAGDFNRLERAVKVVRANGLLGL